ncbi:hypothetical protein KC19_8G198700 [Ceratodon purpureus]|uniref:Protein kinase domain-containing protein n=1 Tax=Ceratodon purpureus TaxID=3225 RepID=A0A8T0H5G7_CERPU|nr:hypothetical protein KC19_8G198700 [Ceratodon purpureus]
MMRSCLSSQRLKKDVIDSLRPSRRNGVRNAIPEKRKVVQPSCGVQLLPLPKPEDTIGEHDANQPPLYLHRSSRYFEEDDQLVFARTTRTPTLCLPPPPVSSPSSSGKCSPTASTGVVCKDVVAQDHPSPAQNGVPPPPPWSSSSSLSLNDSSSPPMSPPAVLEITTPLLPAESPLTYLGNDSCSLQSSSFTSSSSSSRRKCSEVPVDSVADIRNEVRVFGLDEIERTCSDANREHGIVIVGDVSVITGWIGEDDGESKRKLVSVVCKHRHSRQGWKDWAAKVNLISRVDDPHICKLQGYCPSDGEQILVYENMCSGSLSDYLFGSLCKALLDWRSRVRIALGAARALAYIHDIAPIEVVYNNFKSSSILLDLDFSVKLAGHGLDVIAWQADKLNKAASMVLRKSEASSKSNIRSYGVFLLELLTGKSITSEEFLNDEKLFTQWAKPYLRDQEQLATVLDPQLRRQFPCPGLKKVAALTLQCLRKDPNKRPSIVEVVDILDTAMDLQPAGRILNRSMNKCMSLPKFQPNPLKGCSRTLSNKQF